jgi:hypothetical protein
MIITLRIEPSPNSVICLDPQVVVHRLCDALFGLEVNPTDYAELEVLRETQRLSVPGADPYVVEPLLRQIKDVARRNGPIYCVRLTTGAETQVDGRVSRYEVTFWSEDGIFEPFRTRILDALRSFGIGELIVEP